MSDFEKGQQCYLEHQECPVDASPEFIKGYGLEYFKAEAAAHMEWMSK